MSWKEGMEVYHDRNQPDHKEKKKIVDACCQTLESRESGEDVVFDPSSEVTTRTRQGMTHFLDVGFFAEQDLVKHFKLGSKELGLKDKLVNRMNEDGSGVTPGIFIRLSDLDELSDRDVMCLRKTRIWLEAIGPASKLGPAN